MGLSGNWLPVGSERGEIRRIEQSMTRKIQATAKPSAGVAAAALLLSYYGPLKESRNSDAVDVERYSIVRVEVTLDYV